MKVKTCGIKNLQDALVSIENNAWALGFNFYKPSPRFVTPEVTKEIISKLPKKTIKIGVFVKQNHNEILNIMKNINLDFAQVYEDLPCGIEEKNQ